MAAPSANDLPSATDDLGFLRRVRSSVGSMADALRKESWRFGATGALVITHATPVSPDDIAYKENPMTPTMSTDDGGGICGGGGDDAGERSRALTGQSAVSVV